MVDNSLSGEACWSRVEQDRFKTGYPSMIVSGNGTELTSNFNKRVRDECLNEHPITSYRHAKDRYKSLDGLPLMSLQFGPTGPEPNQGQLINARNQANRSLAEHATNAAVNGLGHRVVA